MSFQVVWDMEAYRVFERWTNEPDIGPALQAYDEIEHLLSSDPDAQGESREDGRRVLLVPPLGIVFRVQSRLQEVYVVRAWMIPHRTLLPISVTGRRNGQTALRNRLK